MNKENPKYNKITMKDFNSFNSLDDAAKKLIADIKLFGIRLPDNFKAEHII
jgi:hypothetical protein